jgi:hypothetical protein
MHPIAVKARQVNASTTVVRNLELAATLFNSVKAGADVDRGLCKCRRGGSLARARGPTTVVARTCGMAGSCIRFRRSEGEPHKAECRRHVEDFMNENSYRRGSPRERQRSSSMSSQRIGLRALLADTIREPLDE